MMENNKTTDSEKQNKYPTYSDELYTSDPEVDNKSTKKLKGAGFKGGYFIKVLFYALMMSSFAFWQIDQEQAKEQVHYYEVETVVSMPSRDAIRELLVPKVQESLEVSEVFSEFTSNLWLLVGAEAASEDVNVRKNVAISIDGDGDKDVSFARGVIVEEDYLFPSNGSVESKVGAKLKMRAYNLNDAKYWMQSLINKAELDARVSLVGKAEQMIADRIYEINSQFSDQLKIDRRQSDQLMADLVADYELAKALGIVVPITSPHPLAPEGVDDDYFEGTEAIKKKIDSLANKLDKGALNEGTQTAADKKLIVELETLKSIELDPVLMLTAVTGYPYVVNKILQENETISTYMLGILWGFLAAWVILRVLSFFRSVYIRLIEK